MEEEGEEEEEEEKEEESTTELFSKKRREECFSANQGAFHKSKQQYFYNESLFYHKAAGLLRQPRSFSLKILFRLISPAAASI